MAIGDNNGDVVYLDPTDEYSVWIWYHDGADVERMWVTITDVDDDNGYYTGIIDNEPVHSAAAHGDEIQFHPLHIAEIIKKRGRWSWS